MKSTPFLILLCLFSWQTIAQNNLFADANRSYSLPTLTKNNHGEVVMYWAEKDDASKMYLYFSTSKDGGKTFADKKMIFADAGIGAGRLMRPKVLFKKSGEMVAVFAHRGGTTATPRPQAPAPDSHAGHGDHKPATPPPSPAGGRGGKRDGQIKYMSSKDGGETWNAPLPVDTDTSKLLRGFFDATILANDDIAVTYLKDVKGSTKHEERDLRLVLINNGIAQPEKLIDPVVCDCCNIGVLVDGKGTLNVFYRDNNDDIRDIAVMSSTDNGETFSKSKIVHNDKWEIKGCPHSGAVAAQTPSGYLATWFSGTEDNGGLRIADSNGKLLKVLEAGAKNAWLATDSQKSAWVWEKGNEKGTTQIFYSETDKQDFSEAKALVDSEGGQNATNLIINGKTLVAYEVNKPNTKTTIKIQTIE